MASVRLKNLSKRYAGESVALGHAAVRDVSMEIKDGEFVVLVGPSGCGKTTILRLIAGLETPDEGEITIGGNVVTEWSPRERDVAMVFQNYALYPHMTVAENIAFPLKMKGMARAETATRVTDVADVLGIGELLQRRPSQLSGGQRQRVALGRAMVRKPKVFLFDEPLSNLDAQVRATTRGELIRLHRTLGTTMIYVTHDQTEAMTMAQRVAVMDAGRIEQFAPPLDVYRSPITLFTASFIGAPPMNVLRGRVEGEGTRQQFVGAIHMPVAAPAAGPVSLAIRPEHLHVTSESGDTGAEVMVVESFGMESTLHCTLPSGEEVRVRTNAAEAVAAGASIRLRVDGSKALLYDADGKLCGRGR